MLFRLFCPYTDFGMPGVMPLDVKSQIVKCRVLKDKERFEDEDKICESGSWHRAYILK